MIAPEHKTKHLTYFSADYQQANYDSLKISSTISELTFNELHWYLRKRQYIEPVIELVLDKIEDNWTEIDIYYPTEICQWYDEVIKEIITLPYEFWDTKKATFLKFCNFIKHSTKRTLPIEKALIELFLNYIPNNIYWTNEDDKQFENELSVGLGLDIAGNIIEAEKMLIRLKYSILNNQEIFIESEYNSIATEEQLIKFIKNKYNDYRIIDDIIVSIQRETKINFIKNKREHFD
jgi:hypothetical protein